MRVLRSASDALQLSLSILKMFGESDLSCVSWKLHHVLDWNWLEFRLVEFRIVEELDHLTPDETELELQIVVKSL